MIRQKCVTVERSDGAYYNFFNSPGSINSLQSFIENGWVVKVLKDDPQAERATAVFEKETEEIKMAEVQTELSTSPKSLLEVEEEHILKVLNLNNGNREKTARDLKIDRKTLYRRLSVAGVQPAKAGNGKKIPRGFPSHLCDVDPVRTEKGFACSVCGIDV